MGSTSASGQYAEKPAVDSEPLLQLAAAQMQGLQQYEGGIRAPQIVLRRNLGRYFFAYEVPGDAAELERLLGALERVWRTLGSSLLREIVSRSVAAGSGKISAALVEAVVAERLPTGEAGRGRLTLFPDDPDRRLILETIDLEALRDTGLLWLVVARIAEQIDARSEAGSPSARLTWEPDAVTPFVGGVLTYGLATLRMAARYARAEYAPAMAPPHLRQAQRLLSGREGAEPLPPWPIEEPPDGPAYFEEISERAGVDFEQFTSDWLSHARRYRPVAPTFSGGGATAVDLDGDRLDDLVLCGGEGCRLWLGRGDGTFDLQASSGIEVDGEARMAVAADFDNDGRRDLFVTYARDTNRLFRNVTQPSSAGRRVHFEDVTATSGLERDGEISGPAVAFDYDDDGRLDLYVGNFGDYLHGASPWVVGDRSRAMPNRLLRNVTHGSGGLRFEDVSENAGIGDRGWAQALSHVDVDGDGDQDLYVANDFGVNALLLNRGDGTFESVAEQAGALDDHHGMNVSFADLNRDRRPDILVTNIWAWDAAKRETYETNTLLLSSEPANGVPRWTVSDAAAIVEHDAGWGWAALFFDLENDADDDLLVLNGFTDYQTFSQQRESPLDPESLFPLNNGRDANVLFVAEGEDPIPSRLAHSGLELPNVNSRSLALADFDRDGRLDAVVTTFHERARLYRNRAAEVGPVGNWLHVDLLGDPERGSNRDAIGATVVATASDDETYYVWRGVHGGEGYLGMSSLTVELGAGDRDWVDLDVTWPGGSTERFERVPTNRRIEIVHGKTRANLDRGDAPPWASSP